MDSGKGSGKFSFSWPSFEGTLKHFKLQSGSVAHNDASGGYTAVDGPKAMYGKGNGFFGMSFGFGEISKTKPVNQNTSFGLSYGFGKGGGVELSKDHMGGDKTSLSVPMFPLGLHMVRYPQGNPVWNEKSRQADDQHTRSLKLDMRQAELRGLKANKSMMSPDDYRRQKLQIQGHIDSLK
ncbi:hypothetical protein [Chitinolyticbacter meiyuanensis]|uniref:hypothetical protein n=1 Tax=Chitinolyticbacter meiyuanensis TaxID=682798 RepID=UPI0011E5CD31|nr:hypothetical protein [Chitinolyticbacter meiyuanensis]